MRAITERIFNHVNVFCLPVFLLAALSSHLLSPKPALAGPASRCRSLVDQSIGGRRVKSLSSSKLSQESAFLFYDQNRPAEALRIENAIESELAEGEIVSVVQRRDSSSEAWDIKFANGLEAVWKPDAGPWGEVHGVYPNASMRHEVAAYLVDRLFGLNLVPVTVFRELQLGSKLERWGSIQYKLKSPIHPGLEASRLGYVSYSRELIMLDYLIQNLDRHNQTNHFYLRESDKKRVVAIDHAAATFVRGIPTLSAERLSAFFGDKSQFLKIRAVSDRTLRRALKHLLSDEEMESFLARRQYFVTTAQYFLESGRLKFATVGTPPGRDPVTRSRSYSDLIRGNVWHF